MQIKYGTTRTVFLIKKYAIKFPRIHHRFRGHRWKMFLRGILANIDENYWYKHSHKKEKMCPVRMMFPLGLFLVMKRADELTEEEYQLIDHEKEFLGLPCDNKITNFGKINGNIVLVDYADSRYMCSDCSFNFKNR